jgi:hypothetical protein
VEARWGGEAFGEHLRAAEGDAAASGSAACGESRSGDAVRDAGRPVSELNSAHQFDGGRSGATAPAQNFTQCGDTTVTVSAWHSTSLLTFLAVTPPGHHGQASYMHHVITCTDVIRASLDSRLY